jgi:hypothetical protein
VGKNMPNINPSPVVMYSSKWENEKLKSMGSCAKVSQNQLYFGGYG